MSFGVVFTIVRLFSGLRESIKFTLKCCFVDLAQTDHPDEKSVMTYVSSLYEIFPKEPTVQETLHDNVSDRKVAPQIYLC